MNDYSRRLLFSCSSRKGGDFPDLPCNGHFLLLAETLPISLDADHPCFLAHGSLSPGPVRFEHPSDKSRDDVKADVTVSYWSTDALARASAMRDMLQFDVFVHLPPRVYADLQTSSGNFSGSARHGAIRKCSTDDV